MTNCNRVLVPVDFSTDAALALDWAIRIAKEERNPTIYLLHVLPYMVDPTYLMGWTDDMVGLRYMEAERELVRWQNKIPEKMSSISLLKKGDIAGEVAAVADEKAINLVVMTTRERRGLSRIPRPNISEDVVRLALCTVLVLHLNKGAVAATTAVENLC